MIIILKLLCPATALRPTAETRVQYQVTVVAYSRYLPEKNLDDLSKTTINLSLNTRCPGQDFNQTPRNEVSTVLLL
jgi:hypothetical protein